MRTTKGRIVTLLLALCVLLTAVSVIFMTGCNNSGKNERGSGATTFSFKVVHKDGSEKTFTIHTDKATLGDALVDEKLIEGEQSTYGLYVKTVDGETLDYDTDQYYWSLLIDGEYAMTGVDSTNVEEGKTYSFVAAKG